MRTKIEPEPGAGARLFAPSLAHVWSKAVDVRFKVANLPQQARFHDCLRRQNLTIPAAIVKYRKQLAPFLSKVNQGASICESDRKRLVHYYVLSRLQRSGREWVMAFIRAGDHQKIHFRVSRNVFDVGTDSNAREIGQHRLTLLDPTTLSWKPVTAWISDA